MTTYVVEYEYQGYGDFECSQDVQAPDMPTALKLFLGEHPGQEREILQIYRREHVRSDTPVR